MSKQSFNPELYSLVTIKEAAHMYYRSPGTIRYHLDRGNLKWRLSDPDNPRRAVCLITLSSLINLYGNPLNTPV
jgi:hypothetical protein